MTKLPREDCQQYGVRKPLNKALVLVIIVLAGYAFKPNNFNGQYLYEYRWYDDIHYTIVEYISIRNITYNLSIYYLVKEIGKVVGKQRQTKVS